MQRFCCISALWGIPAARSAAAPVAPQRPTWSWNTRFGPSSSTNAAPIPAANLSAGALTVQPMVPEAQSCWECPYTGPIVPDQVVGFDFNLQTYLSAQVLGVDVAYIFYGFVVDGFGTLLGVSLGLQANTTIGPCNATGSNGTCPTGPPFGTVVSWDAVPEPAECTAKHDDDYGPDCQLGISPDLIVVNWPTTKDRGSTHTPQQVAITVSTTGLYPGINQHGAYLITAFNVSMPYIDPSSTSGPSSRSVLWSHYQQLPRDTAFPQGPLAFVRLVQVYDHTIAVLAAGCAFIAVDLYDLPTGEHTGAATMHITDPVPGCGSEYSDMAVAATPEGYIAVTLSSGSYTTAQSVVAGRVVRLPNGTLTVDTLWSSSDAPCNHPGRYSMCQIVWPYDYLLLDASRGILLRYCIDGDGEASDPNACLAAMNASTGERLWATELPGGGASLSIATGPGVVTAVVNTIYGFTGSGSDPLSQGIDIVSGAQVWSWSPTMPNASTLFGWSLIDGQGRLIIEKQVTTNPTYDSEQSASVNVSFLAVDAATGVLLEESVPYADAGWGWPPALYGMKGMPFQLGRDGMPYGWIPNYGPDLKTAAFATLRPTWAPSPSPPPPPPPPGPAGPNTLAVAWQIPVAASVGGVVLTGLVIAGVFGVRRRAAASHRGRASGAGLYAPLAEEHGGVA